MEEKEDFYRELDHKSRHSFCSCQTLAIGLIILAILAAVGITMAVRKVSTVLVPTRPVVATRDDQANVQQKIADLNKAPGASVTVTITESELTSLLIEALAKSPNFPLRGMQASIAPDGITLTGTATKYFNAQVTAAVTPSVVDGHIKLDVSKIQAGSLEAPSILRDQIAKGLDSLLSSQVSNLQGITIKSIQLHDGRMTISGLNPS